MPQAIIYKNGVYNIFSTVVDAPFFEPGLTKEELENFIKEEYGNQGLKDLPKRLERAHTKGTSMIGPNEDLESTIIGNRASKNETELSYEKFVNRFLTLGE